MQTKLRVLGLAVVASLLWINPMSAATPGIKVQANAKKLKVQFLGVASWYGITRQGRKMANGQLFDRHKFTAASWYFPLGTQIRVVNVKNGQSVVVTITDRGPNLRLHRVLDLSEAAAEQLDYLGQGLAPVFLYPLAKFELQAASFDVELIDAALGKGNAALEAKALVPPM
jgi:rare lipoprotein A (peptidoglycan hydrolase)